MDRRRHARELVAAQGLGACAHSPGARRHAMMLLCPSWVHGFVRRFTALTGSKLLENTTGLLLSLVCFLVAQSRVRITLA